MNHKWTSSLKILHIFVYKADFAVQDNSVMTTDTNNSRAIKEAAAKLKPILGSREVLHQVADAYNKAHGYTCAKLVRSLPEFQGKSAQSPKVVAMADKLLVGALAHLLAQQVDLNLD